MDTLLQCGNRYYLERILRAPQVPAWYFIGGSVVHSMTEHLDRSVLKHGEPWNQELIESTCGYMFDDQIKEAQEIEPDTSKWGMGGRKGAKEDETWWRTNAPKMVQLWQDWHYSPDNTLELWTLPNGEPAIEVEIMTTFGDVPVKMAIDRIMVDVSTGELIVVDIKCGSREPASSYQLALYAEAVRRAFGYPVRYGAYWMSRKGALTLPKDLAGLIGDLDNRFAKARLMVDNEVYLAVPGMFCNSCAVRTYCTAVGGDPAPLFGKVS